ncbi:MAG: type II toxin-antitoxin system HicB family antitoxin [Dehalococcoidia bacterium]
MSASKARRINIETEREEDGRWIAEIPDLPGVMTCGQSREEAISNGCSISRGSPDSGIHDYMMDFVRIERAISYLVR